MNTTTHFLTLPPAQAEWFEEVCQQLGISVFRVRDKIKTVCTNEERNVAWELFREEFLDKMQIAD